MRTSALIALLLPLGISCMPLDRRPPRRTANYARGVQLVTDAADTARMGRGEYEVGWARVPIETPAGAPLAGFGDRDGVPHTGVRDPVFVRAFAIGAGRHRVVLFTADILLIGRPAAHRIREQLSDLIDPDAIFFTASHTHSGPGGYVPGRIWEIAFGAYSDQSFENIVVAHVNAAKKALADMSPAKVGTAEIQAHGLIKNRVELNGPTDDTVFVLRFDKKGKSAAIWSFGCHAVVLPHENLLISADYPGEVAKKLEGKSMDVVAYAAGGVGSSNPKVETLSFLSEPLTKAVSNGLKVAKRSRQKEGAIASAQTFVPIPPIRYRVTRELMISSTVIQSLVEMHTMSFGAVAIGDAVLLHMPGEMSGELTSAARRHARAKGITLAILPFNGTYVGYVVPRRVYNLPANKEEELFTYETHTMTFFGPWSGDIMMNLGLRLAAGVRAQATSDGGASGGGADGDTKAAPRALPLK